MGHNYVVMAYVVMTSSGDESLSCAVTHMSIYMSMHMSIPMPAHMPIQTCTCMTTCMTA